MHDRRRQQTRHKSLNVCDIRLAQIDCRQGTMRSIFHTKYHFVPPIDNRSSSSSLTWFKRAARFARLLPSVSAPRIVACSITIEFDFLGGNGMLVPLPFAVLGLEGFGPFRPLTSAAATSTADFGAVAGRACRGPRPPNFGLRLALIRAPVYMKIVQARKEFQRVRC